MGKDKKKIKKYGIEDEFIGHAAEPAVAYASKSRMSIIDNYSDDKHHNLKVIKNGLAYSDMRDLMDLAGIHLDDMAAILHVTSRTLRRLDPDIPLSVDMSERILDVLSLYKLGLEIFDDIHVLNVWMRRPLKSLGYQVPFELLDTGLGIDIIKDSLYRLAYGVHG